MLLPEHKNAFLHYRKRAMHFSNQFFQVKYPLFYSVNQQTKLYLYSFKKQNDDDSLIHKILHRM